MLKSIMALGKMQFKQYNIYKSNFYLFTLNRIVEVVVYIFVWQAIYNQTGNAGGLTIAQMVTYYILVVTLGPISLWGINEDMAHSIRNGRINKELLNPITYFQYYFGLFCDLIFFTDPHTDDPQNMISVCQNGQPVSALSWNFIVNQIILQLLMRPRSG